MTPSESSTTTSKLYLAEYNTPAECLHAAEKLRDAGYKSFDAHTPFPVHGMDKAMGLSDSVLGYIVFPLGLTGALLGFAMIHWMNGVDYPLVIGGKPTGAPGAIPAMVPIMFELTILLSAFGAVFGMLHLNRLPRHHHPVFYSDRFTAATDDKFFISVESADPLFHLEKTKALLEKTGASHLELVEDTGEDCCTAKKEVHG